MLAGLYHDERRRAQQRHATDGEHPSAVAASLGQVKAGVVDDSQRDNSVAIGHSDVLAVDRGRSGQQLRAALLALAALSGLDNDLDRLPQQHIALVGGNFGQRIGIVLQPLDHDVSLCIGNKSGGVSFLCGKALGIIHAILLLSNHEYIIGVVVQTELHVPQVAAVVGKLLENVNAVGVDMAAIVQGVKIGAVRSAPGQLDLVGVVGIAHLGVGGQDGRVSNAHGAIGIAALYAVGEHVLFWL